MNHERCECHDCTQARLAMAQAGCGLASGLIRQAMAGSAYTVKTITEGGKTRYFNGNGNEEFVTPTQT